MSDTICSVSNENDKRGVHKKVIKYFIVKMLDDLTSLSISLLYESELAADTSPIQGSVQP